MAYKTFSLILHDPKWLQLIEFYCNRWKTLSNLRLTSRYAAYNMQLRRFKIVSCLPR